MRLGALLALAGALAVSASPARAANDSEYETDAAAPPACTAAMAQMAIEGNQQFLDEIRATGAIMTDQDVFDVFMVSKLICHDLTGDGKADMAVMLDCCGKVSPTPFAIFRPHGMRWKLVYRSSTLLISKLRRKGLTIRLTHPVYKRTDEACCPSSHTRWAVRWRRDRFVRSRL